VFLNGLYLILISPPGASSETGQSQIALPSFEMAVDWRLICRLCICSYLSIGMLGDHLQLAIHLHLGVCVRLDKSPLPGASSEMNKSQIALPSFLRLLAEFTSI